MHPTREELQGWWHINPLGLRLNTYIAPLRAMLHAISAAVKSTFYTARPRVLATTGCTEGSAHISRVRAHRARELLQAQFAGLAGSSWASIVNIEHGRQRAPLHHSGKSPLPQAPSWPLRYRRQASARHPTGSSPLSPVYRTCRTPLSRSATAPGRIRASGQIWHRGTWAKR
jgi:hypothetical protein